MLRPLYDRLMRVAGGRRATIGLGAVSFAESSFFPIPPDVMLVPMTVARPERAWFYATVCTLTSVAGGLLGYAIGALLYDTVGLWLISAYGMSGGMDEFRAMYAKWGDWIILIKGLTPIPFKLVTIASGFAGYDIWKFIAFSLITRGLRFFVLAGILNRFGVPIRRFLEAHLGLSLALLFGVMLCGFLVVRLIF